MKKHILKAFSLTEVVIVLIVIAVVVSASIKITKTKMDSVMSYTYYLAYETLRVNVEEILKNFNAKDEIYTSFKSLIDPPYSGECNIDTDGPLFNEDETKCLQPPTLPRNGMNLCLKFAEGINLLGTFREENLCNGDEIDITTPVFTDKAPDMVLSNGLRIFNMAKGELSEISKLKADVSGTSIPGTVFKTVASGTKYNVNTYGYTVYVDINGVREGENSIGDDIFPFFITLSGIVIPDYNITWGGGNNKLNLQVSLSKLAQNSAGIHYPAKWVLKSVSYQEAACKGGRISSDTEYCIDADGNKINVMPDCSVTSGCRLHTLSPIKGFGIK